MRANSGNMVIDHFQRAYLLKLFGSESIDEIEASFQKHEQVNQDMSQVFYMFMALFDLE